MCNGQILHTDLRHNWHHENEDDDDQLESLLKFENQSTQIFVKALGLGPSNQHFGHEWKHDLILKKIIIYICKNKLHLVYKILWTSKLYFLALMVPKEMMIFKLWIIQYFVSKVIA
jgi:hypothetical protein